MLLLGVGHTANTTVHVGEFHADAPYLDIPFDPDWPTHGSDRFPGCSRAFGLLERPLRDRGAIRDGKVGGALTQLVPARGDRGDGRSPARRSGGAPLHRPRLLPLRSRARAAH